MKTTEHQRVPTLPKQHIATLLGGINVHLVGNGPAMVCWPSLMMTGQMWRGQGGPLSHTQPNCLLVPPPPRETGDLERRIPPRDRSLCLKPELHQIESYHQHPGRRPPAR